MRLVIAKSLCHFSRSLSRTPIKCQANCHALVVHLKPAGRSGYHCHQRPGWPWWSNGRAFRRRCRAQSVGRNSKHENGYPPKSATRLLLWVDRQTWHYVFAARNNEQEIHDTIRLENQAESKRGQTYVGTAVVVHRGLGHHRVAAHPRQLRTMVPILAFQISGIDRTRKSGVGRLATLRRYCRRAPVSYPPIQKAKVWTYYSSSDLRRGGVLAWGDS